MRSLIIQKDSVNSLFRCCDSQCDFTNDLVEFLTSEFDGYSLICDFESNLEYEAAALKNPILEALLDKFINITYEPKLLNKIESNEFYSGLSQRNIFLTEFTEQKCVELSLKRGFIFISSKEVKKTWSRFRPLRKGKSLKVTRSKEVSQSHRLDNWSKVREWSVPLTGLIIFDKHLLDIHPSEIGTNLIPLIVSLIEGTFVNRTVFVTIISEPKYGFTLKKYADEINKALAMVKLSDVRINIVRHNKAFYPRDFEGLHARVLLSNFLHIVSDASLNFFKKNGNVVNVANVTATLNLSGYCNQSYQKDINDLKSYIHKLSNSSVGDLNYSDCYYPDKMNPLLH